MKTFPHLTLPAPSMPCTVNACKDPRFRRSSGACMHRNFKPAFWLLGRCAVCWEARSTCLRWLLNLKNWARHGNILFIHELGFRNGTVLIVALGTILVIITEFVLMLSPGHVCAQACQSRVDSPRECGHRYSKNIPLDRACIDSLLIGDWSVDAMSKSLSGVTCVPWTHVSFVLCLDTPIFLPFKTKAMQEPKGNQLYLQLKGCTYHVLLFSRSTKSWLAFR
jgi:hypothetical protein